MNKTSIEWALNPDGSPGYTHNPMSGCRYHTPDGLCLGGMFPCYAHKLANGRLKGLILGKTMTRVKAGFHRGNFLPPGSPQYALTDPFYPRFWSYRLNELAKRNDRLHYDGPKVKYPITPRGIFLGDMADLFGVGVPHEWSEMVLDEIWGNKGYDRFYILTKQAQRLAEFPPFPDNCWVGVTATDQTMVLEATNYLYEHRIAKTQFLSIEPLLSWDTSHFIHPLAAHISKRDIDWLIIGACTGTYSEITQLCALKNMAYTDKQQYGQLWTLQPKIEWVREIIKAADAAGIRVFLKDNLRPLFAREIEGTYQTGYPGGQYRQEVP